MGKKDNRRSRKMLRKKAQRKKLDRISRRLKAAQAPAKPVKK